MAKSARAVPPSFPSRNMRRVGRLGSVVRGASDAIFDFALNWLFFCAAVPTARFARARARAAGRRGAPHQPLLPRRTPCAQGAGGRGGEGRGGGWKGAGPRSKGEGGRCTARRGARRHRRRSCLRRGRGRGRRCSCNATGERTCGGSYHPCARASRGATQRARGRCARQAPRHPETHTPAYSPARPPASRGLRARQCARQRP